MSTPQAKGFGSPPDIETPTNAESTPSNDERWSLIWIVLVVYWAIDALLVFLLAFVSFIVSVAFFAATTSSCSVTGIMFLFSSLIFITRLFDLVIGCCTIGFWFCGTPGSDQEDRRLLPHIRNCIVICGLQCLFSFLIIVTGIVGLVTDTNDCPGASVSIVFAFLLLLDAGWNFSYGSERIGCESTKTKSRSLILWTESYPPLFGIGPDNSAFEF